MAASLRRLPQTHLPLSGSNFARCNDVVLDAYNDPGPNFVAAYTGRREIGRSRECKLRRRTAWRRSGSLVQLLQQLGKVSQPVGARGVLQGLVLRQDVDKTLADLVAVPAQQVAAAIAEPVDDVVDAGRRPEGLSHSSSAAPGPAAVVGVEAAARPSSGPRRARATAGARPPAERL